MAAWKLRQCGGKKATLILPLAILLLLALTAFAAGCGEDQATNTSAASVSTVGTEDTTAGGAETTAVQAETSAPQSTESFVLKVATQSAEGAWPALHAEKPWHDAITEATGGRVTWEIYYANSLAKTPDFWQAVESNIADVAFIPMTAYPGVTPLSDVVTLPFLPFESSAQASGILWQLYEEFPGIRAEWEPNKVNYFVVGACNHIIGHKLYKVMDDFRGQKIRPTGGSLADEQLELLGANAAVIPGSEVYLSLEQGVIDSVVSQWDFTIGFRFYEIANNITYVPMSGFIISNVMNADRYDSLPTDVQQAIDDASGLARATATGDAEFDALYDKALAQMRETGIEAVEYTVPDDELAKWTEVAGRPLWEQWVQEMTAAGHPEAQEILDRTFELIETYHVNQE